MTKVLFPFLSRRLAQTIPRFLLILKAFVIKKMVFERYAELIGNSLAENKVDNQVKKSRFLFGHVFVKKQNDHEAGTIVSNFDKNGAGLILASRGVSLSNSGASGGSARGCFEGFSDEC